MAEQISPTVDKQGPFGNCDFPTETPIDIIISKIDRIDKIYVRHDEHCIRAITVHYGCGENSRISSYVDILGLSGNDQTEINFSQDEYITHVKVWHRTDSDYVNAIQIITNKSSVHGPYGNADDKNTLHEFEAGGGKIIGFHGYSYYGGFVRAIGVYVKERDKYQHQQKEDQQLAEPRLREQLEETRLRQQVCDENELNRMIKENGRFRKWVEHAKSSDSNVDVMFTWLKPDELPTTYSHANFLGAGGCGLVFRAVIKGKEVAIKKNINPDRQEWEREFKQEINILGNIRHPNLVTLIGACSEQHTLVYEYLPNGNLMDHIAGRRGVLSWSDRTKIAACICSTLIFLHKTEPDPIAHGDLKPENILFDINNVCKLGDFGISRFLENVTQTGTAMHETKSCKGTPAYRDPEYEETGILTLQSDVYSFGIILLQLVTGDCSAEGLRKKVLGKIGSLDNFIKKTKLAQKMILGRFPNFSGDWPIDEAVKMTCLGIRCSEDKRKNRPDLEDVRVEIVNGFASID